MDPIEKKPLYHFYPGSTIFSVGFFGCNFHCPFCQNYTISQRVEKRKQISPESLVEMACESGSFGIAYTYSEPLIHFEYVQKAAELAHSRGLKNVLVSNGHLNPEPAKELLSIVDAANIDLKSFNPDFYRKELGGNFDSVLEFLSIASKKTSLEVTTLVIPGKNDSDQEINQIAQFVSSLDSQIPLHLSCYYPTYKYSVGATPTERIVDLTGIAGEILEYVYPGNVGLRESNTFCPDCGSLLIRRAGYYTSVVGIKDGRCSSCENPIPIVGV